MGRGNLVHPEGRREPVDGRPLVFVTVGTDHHPFDRVARWIDDWMGAGGGDQRARVFMQSGTSAPPKRAASAELVTRHEMQCFLRSAVAVVCHGGPASITECRSAGIVPIVVPRLHRLGEHVDDHQVLFTRSLADLGRIHLAESSQRLAELLDGALVTPEAFRLPPGTGSAEGTVAEFGRVVATLFSNSAGDGRRRNRRRVPAPFSAKFS